MLCDNKHLAQLFKTCVLNMFCFENTHFLLFLLLWNIIINEASSIKTLALKPPLRCVYIDHE